MRISKVQASRAAGALFHWCMVAGIWGSWRCTYLGRHGARWDNYHGLDKISSSLNCVTDELDDYNATDAGIEFIYSSVSYWNIIDFIDHIFDDIVRTLWSEIDDTQVWRTPTPMLASLPLRFEYVRLDCEHAMSVIASLDFDFDDSQFESLYAALSAMECVCEYFLDLFVPDD